MRLRAVRRGFFDHTIQVDLVSMWVEKERDPGSVSCRVSSF
jgi:hypothetical protein